MTRSDRKGAKEGFKNNSHTLPEGPSPQRGEGLG